MHSARAMLPPCGHVNEPSGLNRIPGKPTAAPTRILLYKQTPDQPPKRSLCLHYICCSAVSDVWQSDSLYGEVSLPQLSSIHVRCSAVSMGWQSDSLYGEVTLPLLSLIYAHWAAVSDVWQSNSLYGVSTPSPWFSRDGPLSKGKVMAN